MFMVMMMMPDCVHTTCMPNRLNAPISGSKASLIMMGISKPYSTMSGICHGLLGVWLKVSTARRSALIGGGVSPSSAGS